MFYRPGPGGAMCVVWWWKVFLFSCAAGIRFTGLTPTARDRLPLAAQQLAVFSEVHQRVLGV